MTYKELKIQLALGVPLSKKWIQLKLQKYHDMYSPGRRTCHLCGNKIMPGDKFFDIGRAENTNICEACSYVSIVQAVKMLEGDE